MSNDPTTNPVEASYGKLRFLCDEIRDRTNDLRHYLGELERGGVCLWCGEGVDFKQMSFEAAVQWAREHDQKCENNPLRAQLRAAEKLIRYADRTDFNDEDWATLFDEYLANYGLTSSEQESVAQPGPTGQGVDGYASAAAIAVLQAEKDLLLEKCETWEALARQINTDWIPANRQLSTRLTEQAVELKACQDRIQTLEAELARKSSTN